MVAVTPIEDARGAGDFGILICVVSPCAAKLEHVAVGQVLRRCLDSAQRWSM